ncbi:unnamed protein product [Angiostrongylus costaricensis]|uniref:Uncharacterized protein n=1 Tax=Angiostrongylus costaricensis TaxID=334426 RepID=A0A3P7HIT7_ANGCS|nr:unnamed protein product [Angiostrongylus costaricensis]
MSFLFSAHLLCSLTVISVRKPSLLSLVCGSTCLQLLFLFFCFFIDLYNNVYIITIGNGISPRTALHWAARRGHESICLLLLRSGFSRELKDSDGRTPWEVRRTFPRIYKLLYIIVEQMRGVPSKSDAVENDRFVPNYIRHPPFPYSKSSSFDYGTGVSSELVVEREGKIINLFSFSDGKEAFKRVTLPGGASLTHNRYFVVEAFLND